MSYRKTFTAIGLAAALSLAFAPAASAQRRAVPRGSVRGGVARGYYRGGPYFRPYYRYYVPSVNLGFFYGYPGYYGAYSFGWGWPYYSYGVYGYGWGPYGYYAPYGYGYSGYSGQPYGGVRLDVEQKDAEVYADGYFVGTVDDFDGRLQQANLEAGPHHIEIRKEGFETIGFDVNVEPGRTITYRSAMRRAQP